MEWFSWLVTSFVRSGRKTVDRFRDLALEDNREGRNEYDEFADELEVTVDKWNRYGIGEVLSIFFLMNISLFWSSNLRKDSETFNH